MTDIGTASLMEIGSAVINLIGIAASLFLLRRNRRQRRAIKTELETLAVWKQFRCHGSRLIFHVGSVGMTIWGMTIVSGDSDYGFVAMLLRIFFGVVFMGSSLQDIWTDERMWDLLSSEASRKESEDRSR